MSVFIKEAKGRHTRNGLTSRRRKSGGGAWGEFFCDIYKKKNLNNLMKQEKSLLCYSSPLAPDCQGRSTSLPDIHSN